MHNSITNILSQIFPYFLVIKANKILKNKYSLIEKSEYEILEKEKIQSHLTQIKEDLNNQLIRKKYNEEKIRSIIFIITISITSITFFLGNNILIANNWFAITILSISIFYLITGSITALTILNVKPFHFYELKVETINEKIVIHKSTEEESLKEQIKNKLLNDIFILQLSNLIYTSFIFFRNGIILFGIYFVLSIFKI